MNQEDGPDVFHYLCQASGLDLGYLGRCGGQREIQRTTQELLYFIRRTETKVLVIHCMSSVFCPFSFTPNGLYAFIRKVVMATNWTPPSIGPARLAGIPQLMHP